MSEPRYGWTQPCCDGCWEERNPGRTATVVIDAGVEVCVYCGVENQSGIYVRIDPDTAPHPTLTKD